MASARPDDPEKPDDSLPSEPVGDPESVGTDADTDASSAAKSDPDQPADGARADATPADEYGDLAPLPDDFTVPDDASALAKDRAAHRMSGLPVLDPLLVRSIVAAVIGFVSTFAMFTGLTSIMMSCTTEAECAARFPGFIPSGIVLFTPLVTAACIIIAIRVAKSQKAKLRWVTAAMFVPILLAAVYFILL